MKKNRTSAIVRLVLMVSLVFAAFADACAFNMAHHAMRTAQRNARRSAYNTARRNRDRQLENARRNSREAEERRAAGGCVNAVAASAPLCLAPLVFERTDKEYRLAKDVMQHFQGMIHVRFYLLGGTYFMTMPPWMCGFPDIEESDYECVSFNATPHHLWVGKKGRWHVWWTDGVMREFAFFAD